MKIKVCLVWNTSYLECKLNMKANKLFLQAWAAFQLVKNQLNKSKQAKKKKNPNPKSLSSKRILSLETLGPRWYASGGH